MTSDKTCRANFSPIPAGFTLTVNKLGGFGRVVAVVPPTSSIDCGGVCSETFEPFTDVFLEDSGDPDTFFAGWISGCDEVNLQNQCFVVMNGDRQVTAAYE